MSSKSPIIAALDSLTAEMSLLKHPFYQQWTAGTLPLARLRNYAVQYYQHVAAFPRYLSGIHTHCEDISSRQTLLENLIDEERGPENHPELWLRFAEALGVTRASVMGAEALPATRALVDTFIKITHDQPLPAGLAALYAYESQIPAVAEAKIDGLRRFYGITDSEGLRFFAVHREADPYHAESVAQMVERHSRSSEDQRLALEAGRTALSAVWSILDAV
ncbi:MAG TPA: CADD family putative folate metabolism protein [Candidatus Binataceae bacterium]|nr:CADD family putative folate metabolism protein [Candidatus Binataceae bacterium]